MSGLRRVAALTAGSIAVLGIGYALVAVGCVRAFGRRAPDPPTGAPGVSILVPLYGDEPGLAENLRAFVEQDYAGPLQVVFGVHDAGDPALPVAEAVRAAFPGGAVTIAVGAPPIARNPKIANLSAMLPHARYDTFVLVDSDMRVDREYVRAVTAPLAQPGVGAVTCIYAARHDGTLASRLGAAFVNEQFAPSALVSSALGPLRHCYGATIALRRPTLDEIGGFAALAAHLADDYVLGRKISERGSRIVLAAYVPRTFAAEPTPGALWRHELRWHRTIRAVEPRGYAFLFLTYPLPFAAIAFACAPERLLARVVLLAAVAARALVALAAGRAFGVRPALGLAPLRDVLGLAVWARGLFPGGVEWRGARLRLERHDRLGGPSPSEH